MKVTCSKCGTEYNFDDAKVTEEGVKVKCTRCENVFRVRKKAFVLTEPMQSGGDGDPAIIPSGDGGPEPSQPTFPPIGAGGGTPTAGGPIRKWLIRQADGEQLDFNEMTTLQRWIVERRVERDDEISHNGVKWKRLGAIPELAPFFSAVEPGVPTMKKPLTPPQESRRAETPLPGSAADAEERGRGRDGTGRKRGRGAMLLGVVALLAIGAAAWAQLTEGGRLASAPARAWLQGATGIDLGTGSGTGTTPVPTPAPTMMAVVSPEPSPAATAVAVASPIASAAVPDATPTRVAVATPAPLPSPAATRIAGTRPTVDSLLQKGYEAYSKGRYKEAIQKYQQAVDAAPDNSEAYALLGLAYLDAGNDELAESSLEASIRLNPRFADAYRYLGLVYTKRGDKPRAVSSFTTYLDLRPNGPTSDDIRKRVASLQGGG